MFVCLASWVLTAAHCVSRPQSRLGCPRGCPGGQGRIVGVLGPFGVHPFGGGGLPQPEVRAGHLWGRRGIAEAAGCEWEKDNHSCWILMRSQETVAWDCMSASVAPLVPFFSPDAHGEEEQIYKSSRNNEEACVWHRQLFFFFKRCFELFPWMNRVACFPPCKLKFFSFQPFLIHPNLHPACLPPPLTIDSHLATRSTTTRTTVRTMTRVALAPTDYAGMGAVATISGWGMPGE